MSKKIISLVLCALMVLSFIPLNGIDAEATTTKTKADAMAWLTANKGETFGNGQCVYLIYAYCSYLGFAHSGPNASTYTTYKIPSDWARVKGGTPQKGDIIIYAGNGGYGHVAIYESDNSTWHQNFDGQTCVVNTTYHYKNDIKAADGSGYWGYIRPDFKDGGVTDSPKVTIDTSSSKYSITNTNAVLCGNIYNPFGAKVSKCGIKLYNESGTLLKDFSNSISFTDSNVKIWFDLNNEVGYTLTRGTKYKYVLYGVVDGKTYSTSTQTFTTKGGYTLSYNANGGTGAPSSQNSLIKYTISSTTPTRSGYTFLGWSTSSSATSASYSAGDTITISSNTTLYAVWKEIPVYNTYQLVYDANDGTGAPEPQTFNGDDTVYLSEEIPTRFGYTFEGWVTEDGFWYYPGQEALFFEDTVLYASWYKYEVSLTDSIILEFDEDNKEHYVEFVPEESGYYVLGTACTDDVLDTEGTLYDSNGNELAYNNDSFYNINFAVSYYFEAGEQYFVCVKSAYDESGTTQLNVWQMYMITYDGNGGEVFGTVDFGYDTYCIPDNDAHRDGYEFLGWSTDPSATEPELYTGDYIMVNSPITLYAVWKVDNPTDVPTTVEPATEITTRPAPEPTTRPAPEPTTRPAPEPTTRPAPEPTTVKPTEQVQTTVKPTVKPTEPVTKPTTKPVTTVPVPSVVIRTPSQTEINYGDSIIFHADTKNLPEGAYIEWTADNDNFIIVSYSSDRSNCTITPSVSGVTVFTVTVYDADGNEISSDTQTMIAKAGFFQKIIAFFKKLFGLTKIIPEAFKY